MLKDDRRLVLIRGGGDLASGVALRLHRAGFTVVITELAQPLAVRRAVSFADAVYEGMHKVEEATARLVKREQIKAWAERSRSFTLDAGEIPVLIDPNADILTNLQFSAVVDARLLKTPPHPLPIDVPLHIGLGPGFRAGENCHAVIETRRSHTLGRVFWNGTTQADTGQPEGDPRRVLRAPFDGIIISHAKIGDHLKEGQLIAEIQSEIQDRKSEIVSSLKGVLRGLIRDGLEVTRGLKIGDVDARDDASMCYLVSDKALSVGGGVLEALLTKRAA